MQIRKCTIDDCKAACELYDRVVLHLTQNINYPCWIYKVYPNDDTVAEGIEKGELYICFKENKAVGVFLLNDDPAGDYGAGDWSISLKEGEYLVIHALAVAPEHSGQGIGKAMVRYCIDQARQRGYKAIRLDAVPKNIPARRMYEGLGFSFAGEKDLKRYETGIESFALYEYIF